MPGGPTRREQLHWFVRGQGTPTVLLHGFTGSAHSFDNLATYAKGPCCALHLPGHHPDAPAQEGFDQSARWLCDAMARAGIRRVVLVGYSLGARLALACAARAPDLCESLFLVSGHPGLDDQADRDARRVADRRWIHLLRGEGIAAFVTAWQALPLWSTQRGLPGAVLANQRAVREAHDAEGLAASLETTGLGEMPPLGDAMGRLLCPVSLVVGARDDKFVRIARAVTARHAHIALHVIEGVGHNVVLEAPASLAALIWPP